MEKMTKVDVNWITSLSARTFLETEHKTHLSLPENKISEQMGAWGRGLGEGVVSWFWQEKRGDPGSCNKIYWRSRNHWFEQI